MKKLVVGLIRIALWGCGKDELYPPVPDTTGPKVIATSPGDGDSSVALNALVTVTFDEDIDPLSITGSSFYLSGNVPGTITYGSRSAALNPDSDFQYGTTYTATVTTAVTDVAGNHMDSNYTWSFTTAFGEIMPLAIGNRWDFQVINFTNPVVPDTSYDSIVIVGDTTIEGEQWFIMNGGALLTNRDDGLWRMAETDVPYLWLKFPGAVGQPPYNADPVSGESVKITYTSKLIVPFPTSPLFYCYGYEITYADQSRKDTLYYQARTGPVLFKYYAVDIFTTIVERWALYNFDLNQPAKSSDSLSENFQGI
jgi:hypothetical protein